MGFRIVLIKCRKFFDLLRNFWIVKDSAQVVNYLVNKYQEKKCECNKICGNIPERNWDLTHTVHRNCLATGL